MRIAIVHGNDGSDVRIGKMCRSLSRIGHDVHFVGWDRRPGTTKEVDLGGATPHVMCAGTRYGRASKRGTARFFLHIVRTLTQLRPDVVQCVNEDNGFMVLPLRGVLYDKLVCDVFDALADRHSGRSRSARTLLRGVSTAVRTGADRLIATDQARFERFGRYRSKAVVIENVPEDPGEDLYRRWPTGPIRVYVAGSLNVRRGIRQILEVADRVEDLHIESAGWLYDDFANGEFANHPAVTFHGIVTARRSLELAAECDAILVYYVPSTVNNIFASPNKVHDALSVGRPVILSREVRIAEGIEEQGLGWTCGWDDVDRLTEIVEGLREHRATLPERAPQLRRKFVEGPNWARMEERLADLYREIEGG